MNKCIIGLQWGDEGKGKIVDILAEKSDIVVRYGGGANAGHTVVVGNNKFALHLLPSGSIRPDVKCVITNGVVLDPEVILAEIDKLAQENITLKNRLLISENAHVVLDYHKKEDQLREEALGKNKIGTTIRGIGPCYCDKVGRSFAIRMADFLDLDSLKSKLQTIVEYKNKFFGAIYNAEPMNCDEIFDKCKLYAKKLKPFITDTTEFLHKSIAEKKSILFEGAQGTLLDLDHGTFPFVTSSNASSLGMAAGSGVPAKYVDEFIGVIKAYTTRVGPDHSHQSRTMTQANTYVKEVTNMVQQPAVREDAAGSIQSAVSYSITIGGIDSVALLHLDTLSGLKELNICRAYNIEGKKTTFFPSNIKRLAKAQPVYETMQGWDEEITEVETFDDLPANAKEYVCKIEELIGKPITMIGVGPKRTQTIFR